ncbi:MAG: response regulator transcription factor [Saprospiraceae bacterium]|nr:response regulator transcription factor [Saprospiraceae bacterium]
MKDIRILIVEDEPTIARNLAMIVQSRGYKVAAIVYDQLEARDKLSQELTDLVLLDINLGGNFDGLEIGKLISERYHLPFIYITSYADENTISQAKVTHPSGYIVKPFEDRDVFAAIEIAWYNAHHQSDSGLNRESINQRLSSPLTKKEFAVLQDLMQGKTYAQIAAEHYITINTVNSHIKHIYSKLGAKNKIEVFNFVNQ